MAALVVVIIVVRVHVDVGDVSLIWDQLTQIQRRVMGLRYGLMGEKEHTIEQIENELMLTREEIRREEAEVLKMLRRQTH